MDKAYRSKVGWWGGARLGVGVIVLIGVGVKLLVQPPLDRSSAILIAIALFVMAVFILWILCSTGYTITDRDLLVRSAFIRKRIPLDEITEVRPSHNPLSSPALSLDRLRVSYERPNGRKRWILISPKLKEQFLDDLAEAAGLEREENRLVRRG